MHIKMHNFFYFNLLYTDTIDMKCFELNCRTLTMRIEPKKIGNFQWQFGVVSIVAIKLKYFCLFFVQSSRFFAFTIIQVYCIFDIQKCPPSTVYCTWLCMCITSIGRSIQSFLRAQLLL